MAHDQKNCRELMPLIEPIAEKLPDREVDNYIVSYKVNYKDLADLSFHDGMICNKCQKAITINDTYYICYICKIGQKNYNICENCYEDVNQHSHPVIRVPVGGTKYLGNLEHFHSIQEDDSENMLENMLTTSIYYNCTKCEESIKNVQFICCVCETVFCNKCFNEFKNGDNCIFNGENNQKHLKDHPVLISGNHWSCVQYVVGFNIQYYKENPDNYFSFLYQPKL